VVVIGAGAKSAKYAAQAGHQEKPTAKSRKPKSLPISV
jgi:hypothetical protein